MAQRSLTRSYTPIERKVKSNDGGGYFDAISQDLPCPKIDAKPSKTKLDAEPCPEPHELSGEFDHRLSNPSATKLVESKAVSWNSKKSQGC